MNVAVGLMDGLGLDGDRCICMTVIRPGDLPCSPQEIRPGDLPPANDIWCSFVDPYLWSDIWWWPLKLEAYTVSEQVLCI